MAELITSDSQPVFVGTLKGMKLAAQLVSKVNYYEWNAKEKRWAKLSDQDPGPPTDLPPGKFDGQIIETPKDAAT